MNQVNINDAAETETGRVFGVSIEGNSYKVTLSDDFYEKITGGEVSSEELIKKSFEFLLEREPANNILSEFDLPVISHYFPEYEDEIKKRI